jgi:hypothetical protein
MIDFIPIERRTASGNSGTLISRNKRITPLVLRIREAGAE